MVIISHPNSLQSFGEVTDCAPLPRSSITLNLRDFILEIFT